VDSYSRIGKFVEQPCVLLHTAFTVFIGLREVPTITCTFVVFLPVLMALFHAFLWRVGHFWGNYATICLEEFEGRDG
jgi:hypothetical protein